MPCKDEKSSGGRTSYQQNQVFTRSKCKAALLRMFQLPETTGQARRTGTPGSGPAEQQAHRAATEADTRLHTAPDWRKNMNSFASTGLIVGIMVGLIIVVFVLKYINRDNKLKTDYDERQKAVRGRSYMFGFYATMITCCIMLVLDTADEGIIHVLGMNAFFLPILIGIVVQFSHAIFNDSYVGLNNNMTRFMCVMSFISIFNIVFGIIPIVKEGLIKDGKLCPSFINLEVGVMFIIICIEMVIKKVIDKKAEAE